MRAMRAGVDLAEAALTAGCYDQSALTNHFKRAYGITPLQWIRAGRVIRNFGQ
jgi:AraC-like DNA-binding protein